LHFGGANVSAIWGPTTRSDDCCGRAGPLRRHCRSHRGSRCSDGLRQEVAYQDQLHCFKMRDRRFFRILPAAVSRPLNAVWCTTCPGDGRRGMLSSPAGLLRGIIWKRINRLRSSALLDQPARSIRDSDQSAMITLRRTALCVWSSHRFNRGCPFFVPGPRGSYIILQSIVRRRACHGTNDEPRVNVGFGFLEPRRGWAAPAVHYRGRALGEIDSSSARPKRGAGTQPQGAGIVWPKRPGVAVPRARRDGWERPRRRKLFATLAGMCTSPALVVTAGGRDSRFSPEGRSCHLLRKAVEASE